VTLTELVIAILSSFLASFGLLYHNGRPLKWQKRLRYQLDRDIEVLQNVFQNHFAVATPSRIVREHLAVAPCQIRVHQAGYVVAQDVSLAPLDENAMIIEFGR